MPYIDIEKAQIFLRTYCLAKYPTSFASGLLTAADQLNKIPTADVVELKNVHPCEVCVHYPPSSGDGKPCCMCPAERKEGKNG